MNVLPFDDIIFETIHNNNLPREFKSLRVTYSFNFEVTFLMKNKGVDVILCTLG